jgi:pimeloyl-ACP methyl ester carboxylesterase
MAGMALLLLVACARTSEGSDLQRATTSASEANALPSMTATAQPSATRPTVRPPFTAIVSAAGVRQWLSCAGPGPPTLVVVPGLAASAVSWTRVLPALRRIVRTCVYDRPGLGQSPPRPDTHAVLDAGGLADELWALLHAAGEDGPYVMLGHSFGGLVARAFVAAHRRAVDGILLLESVTPGDPTLPRYWTEAGHAVDLVASAAATGGGPPLGSTPLVVLSASEPDRDHLGGPPYGQPAWMTALWRTQQRDDVRLSTASVQVVAHAGHVVQQDDPAAVAMAVRVLVRAVLARAAPSCQAPWSLVEASCR